MGQLEDHLGMGQKSGSQKQHWKATAPKNSKRTLHQCEKNKQKKLVKELNQTVGSTYGQRVNIDDHEVQGHGEGHGRKQPEVAPWGHANQRLVLRQALDNKNKRNNENNS